MQSRQYLSLTRPYKGAAKKKKKEEERTVGLLDQTGNYPKCLSKLNTLYNNHRTYEFQRPVPKL